MKRNRRVKIVATLGPASSDPDMLERLFAAGVDVFRINMSHSTHEVARKLHAAVRNAEVKFRRPIGILCDLQGPKFRIGEIEGGRTFLSEGSLFRFDTNEEPGNSERVFLPHPQIFEAVEPGHTLLLDDGKLKMRVVDRSVREITAEVLVGGALASRKGIATPDSILPINPITEKDRADLDFVLRLGVDWVALSFVQRGEDLVLARRLIGQAASIMAKIEKPSAIADLDEIIANADGFMVARGDLGVEMPIEKVPGLQKQITRKARAAGKPVVVATQMLESMISSPVPTRAEVSDVATAVFDGADAIMLSAESAVGQFPLEAVQMMNRIAIEVENDPGYDDLVHAMATVPQPTGADAIAAAVHKIARTLKLSAIICYTATGSTALRVARERPGLPVIGLTPVLATGRKLSLVWGIHSVLTSDPANLADMVRKACRIAFEEKFAGAGDGVIITAGVPLGTPGTTNMVRMAYLDENGAPLADQG
ncbi:MAG: pyruvate kinase [Pseudomonadota bacterium]|jgi:pyruvate kinase|nr:MAG: pyruvate kinase [Pseudomonadota bacterium]